MTEIRRRDGRPTWLEEIGEAQPLPCDPRIVHKDDLPFDDGILEQLLWPAAHKIEVRW
ncbi:hypothetical protein [Rhizobium leguminosarum]|uniref:hypothetical protein n=1 Tax=Rhizobium leguminosarum TaxID=384 RepID=UPI00144204C4|nr:hypothetical protein [Rhizobium leguminosarum]